MFSSSLFIVLAICTLLGGIVFVGIVALVLRMVVSRAKAGGVNVLDGIDPEELAEMIRIFKEVRQSELQLRVKQKLAAAKDATEAPPRQSVAAE
ncbi:MAG: hypothetical protein Aurels2KO_25440 [Aureliella sp.]